MVGKNCFAIASDRRLGVNLQTIATDFQRIFKIHDKLYIGLSGLATDVQTLYQRLIFRHKLYQLREERDMKPQTFASLVSAILYEKRFDLLGLLLPDFPKQLGRGALLLEVSYSSCLICITVHRFVFAALTLDLNLKM
ncbi:hypothetical protein BHE74_00010561 [Ensete ventricosum]|nr:hypothetical protein GW17_00055597 [Ensete ventricosum]RWW81074.1 hypothetical protein BHE74_00010561 [Ensete ventricosum]RZS13723.1 hypothetical protein BHM03_00045355 [Ensete ventricosum]